jgi:hypothetical protein
MECGEFKGCPHKGGLHSTVTQNDRARVTAHISEMTSIRKEIKQKKCQLLMMLTVVINLVIGITDSSTALLNYMLALS